MLEELSVTNYALIDDLKVSFKNGFNVLSGETGAGKSLLAGALGLILGKKADGSYVRRGESLAEVSAVIDISQNPAALNWLKERDIEDEEGSVIIRRVVKTSGRGSNYIQGTSVTRGNLEELTSYLFDMHGQHEHQSLFNTSNHRRLLDSFGKNLDMAMAIYNDFQLLSATRNELEERSRDKGDYEDTINKYRKDLEEIEEAQLQADEEDVLEEKLKVLRNSGTINGSLEDITRKADGPKGLLNALNEVKITLDGLTLYETEFESLVKRLSDAYFEIEDIFETVKEYKNSQDFSPEALSSAEERISEIYTLQKKMQISSLPGLLEYAEKCRQEIEAYSRSDSDLDSLRGKIKELEERILSRAKTLSAKRKEAAIEIEKKVIENLKDLSLPNVRFKVEIETRKDKNGNSSCGPWGMDNVEFLMSMNPGEELKPVRQIASGGEISRIMLALKTVLADVDNVGCLIFDEIDSGIGGEVAVSIGEHFKKLSQKKQILSITHLATIAAYADNHLKVVKETDGQKTNTNVLELSEEQRVKEIARMLSGDSNSEESLNHALKMLERIG